MKKNKDLILAGAFFGAFLIFTILVAMVDRNAIGPNGSIVGLSSMNKWFADIIGCNMMLYKVTDWVSILAVVTAVIYAVIGIMQWIKRKKLAKVDSSILILGVFYIAIFVIYVMFNHVVLNYRPVLINGNLEPSFPSSTTLMSITFLMFSNYQSDRFLKNKNLKLTAKISSTLLMLFLVIGRVISGVHWLSDIIASVLLSLAIVFLYYYLCKVFEEKKSKKTVLTDGESNENPINEANENDNNQAELNKYQMNFIKTKNSIVQDAIFLMINILKFLQIKGKALGFNILQNDKNSSSW